MSNKKETEKIGYQWKDIPVCSTSTSMKAASDPDWTEWMMHGFGMDKKDFYASGAYKKMTLKQWQAKQKKKI